MSTHPSSSQTSSQTSSLPSTDHHTGGFVIDMKAIRERARAELEKGALTDAYGLDLERVLTVLNEVVATEIVCTLRYHAHAFACDGIDAEVAATEFRAHASQEWQHMMRVAERIDQLGGAPDLDPSTLIKRSHAEFSSSQDLRAMIEEDLVAERIAVQTYQEIVRWLGDGDPTTRRLMEDILAEEEHHADDMLSLLAHFDGVHPRRMGRS